MSQLKTPGDIIAFLEENGYSVTEKDTLLIIQEEDELKSFAVVDEYSFRKEDGKVVLTLQPIQIAKEKKNDEIPANNRSSDKCQKNTGH